MTISRHLQHHSTSVATQQDNIRLLAELEHAGAIVDRGLILPPDLPYTQYEAIGRMLWTTRDMIQWLIGDWLNYGEDQYDSDTYTQAAHMTGAADQTLLNWKSVAKRVPPQRRHPNVEWTKHSEVACLAAADQKRILKRAESEQLTKMQVRDLVRETQGLGNGSVTVLEQERCPECGRPLP